MALDNVTSRFSTILEPTTSASFLSSLSIIHVTVSQDILDIPLLSTADQAFVDSEENNSGF